MNWASAEQVIERTAPWTVHAITSPRYARVQNDELAGRMLDLMAQHPAWHLPLGYKDGEFAAEAVQSGYLGDRDMFLFLVDRNRFAQLVGKLARIPSRMWPRVIAIAVALRYSWRCDGPTRAAERLRVSLAASASPTAVRLVPVPDHHAADSPARLGPVKALRFVSTPRSGAYGLDWSFGRALFWLSRDGRAVMRTFTEEARRYVNCRSRLASR